MKQKEAQMRAVQPLHADVRQGLSSAQVAERQSCGLKNTAPPSSTRSVGQIVRENSLTFFNLIFLVLGAALALVGSFKNMLFLLVAAANSCISVYQELRAKRAVDKLTLLAVGTLPVIRDGAKKSVRTDALVRDDIVEFSAGDQICADAVVREGALSVNESLLTGEADAVKKEVGDTLRSGSFVISGRCRAELTQVGAQSYAARLAAEAKRDLRAAKSEMMRSLTKLITVVGIALIPMGIFLFLRHYLSIFQGLPLRESVEATVGALVGMIPEGLYLLTSVAIAASSMKLARSRVLVQDMNCIETLARVDILCVDKTGTITAPEMEVCDVQPLDSEHYPYERIEAILAAFYAEETPDNDTARAMAAQFAEKSDWRADARIPFSSEKKWAAADFGENGRYLVGAPEFLLGARYDSVKESVEAWAARGCRTLLLAQYGARLSDALDCTRVTPVALIFLTNRLRPNAKETFRFFAAQGVSVRVISGDNPLTASNVAASAGIENAERYVDATTLQTDADFAEAVKQFTVFGRVTPEQKRKLVRAFQSQGHTVAMTGDGVNDVLALKDADCGIAMASGAQAASQVAQIVLLDSQFSAMPAVVAEGRRVINNIQRAASLFLVKNIFSFAFTLLVFFLNVAYPLQAIQLSLISTLTIGVPSFFLALEPNYARVEGRFMRNVIRRAMPGGLTNVLLVLFASILKLTFGLSQVQLSTMCVWVLAVVGIVTLYYISIPFTRLRLAVLVTVCAAMAFCLLVIPGFFGLAWLDWKDALLLILLLLACPTVLRFFLHIFDRRAAKYATRRKLRKPHPKKREKGN